MAEEWLRSYGIDIDAYSKHDGEHPAIHSLTQAFANAHNAGVERAAEWLKERADMKEGVKGFSQEVVTNLHFYEDQIRNLKLPPSAGECEGEK